MKAVVLPRALSALTHQVTRNTFWLLAGRIGTHGLMAVFTLLIARRLGEIGLGQYAFMTSLVYLANVVTTFGTDMYLIRQIAADRDLSAVPTVLTMQLALALPVIGVIFLLPADLFHLSPEAALALRLYSLSLIPMAFYSLLSAVLRGAERMDAFTGLNLAVMAVQVIAVWIAIQPERGIVRLAAILLGTQVFASLLAGILCLRVMTRFRHVWKRPSLTVRNVVQVTAPIALLSVLGIFYQRAAIYLLMFLAGAEVTGWFSAAMRVVEIPKFGHYAVMGALLPMMVQANTQLERREPIHRLLSRSFLWLMILYAAVAALLFALAAPIIILLFGDSFAPSIAVLKGLVWTLIPFTMTNYLSLRLFAVGQERQMLLPLAVSIAVLLVASLISIPRWGAIGAAGSVWAAESVLAIGYLILWQTSRVDATHAHS